MANVSTNHIMFLVFFLHIYVVFYISLDKEENIGMFMLDLSNAFDCIPHYLVAKLYAYSFIKDCVKHIYS